MDKVEKKPPVVLRAGKEKVSSSPKVAMDNIDEVVAILAKLGVPREKCYIHIDGALSGVILPFVSSRCENSPLRTSVRRTRRKTRKAEYEPHWQQNLRYILVEFEAQSELDDKIARAKSLDQRC
jgi:glutamate/tyrosine decarboxylase-like PLP-dependent enzyme